jgi:hypothetical protein
MTGAATDEPFAFTMPVERGKIREFAIATGSRSPEYLDADDAPIPATFLRTVAFWRPDGAPSVMSGLDLNLRRILHGEQEFVFFGEPPTAGTELTVTQRLESVTEKEGRRGGTMRLVVVVDDFTDPAGRLVAQARSTLIETGKPPSETAPSEEAPS